MLTKTFFAFLFLAISQIASAAPLIRWADTVYGTPATARLPWGGGWTHIAPFQNPNETTPSFLIYNKTTGDVHIDRVTNNGAGFEIGYAARWAPGWTNFTTFVLNKNSYLIAYNATTGEVHIDRLLPNNAGIEILWMGKWGTGWTHLNTFSVNGSPALIAYNATTGLVHFDWISKNLQGTQTVTAMQWGKGWTQFNTYTNDQGKNWFLTAYNANTGLFHIDSINPQLNGVTGKIEKTLAKNLVVSVGQKFDETTPANRVSEIITYAASTGEVQVWEHPETKTFNSLTKSAWQKNLTHIVPFYIYTVTPFDGVLLTYSTSHGGAQFYRLNNRSQMTCFGSGKICEFKNTPLLNQIDPNINDNPYVDSKRWGCYDTTIMMTSVSAMMNQTLQSGPAPFSRSQQLLMLVNKNGLNSTSITQFQYDTARAGKPYYLNELIANFSNGKTVATLPAGCDLYTMGKCQSASSEYGDSSRLWAATEPLLTSSAIIRGLESGARYIFAFNWSDNTKTPEKHIVKARTDLIHKVAIVGFDKNSFYPLTVNDPGNGTRERARIVNLSSSTKMSVYDVDGKILKNWMAVEFEKDPGVYNLFDHVDHIRLF